MVNTTAITGAIICLAGILLTIVGHSSASGGGTYRVFWGAIIVGAIIFFKGFMQEPSERVSRETSWQGASFFDKGVALHKQRKYGEAIKAFDEAIKLDPTDANIWNKKGASLEALGETEEASVAFDKADELNELSRSF